MYHQIKFPTCSPCIFPNYRIPFVFPAGNFLNNIPPSPWTPSNFLIVDAACASNYSDCWYVDIKPLTPRLVLRSGILAVAFLQHSHNAQTFRARCPFWYEEHGTMIILASAHCQYCLTHSASRPQHTHIIGLSPWKLHLTLARQESNVLYHLVWHVWLK